MDDIKEAEGLEFTASTHTYRLDGIELPSVSRIMEPLSQAKYKNVSGNTLNQAADRGTSVHDAIEMYIRYGVIEIPEERKGYLDAFMDWYNFRKPTPIVLEYRTFHKILRYAGTIDNVSEIDGVKTLVDYKTTYSPNSTTFGVQLEAYAKALESQGIKVERKIILHLTKDGKWREIPFPTPDPESWRVFTALKTVYDYIHKP